MSRKDKDKFARSLTEAGRYDETEQAEAATPERPASLEFENGHVPLGGYYAIIGGNVVAVPDALKDNLTVHVSRRHPATQYTLVCRRRDGGEANYVRAFVWGGQPAEGFTSSSETKGGGLVLAVGGDFARVGYYICVNTDKLCFALPPGTFRLLYEVVANTPDPDYCHRPQP